MRNFTTILAILLFTACTGRQNTMQDNYAAAIDSRQLADTIINGNRIILQVDYDQVLQKCRLFVNHNDLESVITLDEYWNMEFGNSLYYIGSDGKLSATWLAATKSAIIIALPYYPMLGLYAYRVKDNAIHFVARMEGSSALFSDCAFGARYDSDEIVVFNQPSSRSEYGASVYVISADSCYSKFVGHKMKNDYIADYKDAEAGPKIKAILSADNTLKH